MKKALTKLIVLLLIAAGSALLGYYRDNFPRKPDTVSKPANVSNLTDLNAIKQAYDNQRSNLHVTQTGKVVKLLRDDNHGLRHQRFIVQLNSGQKLLIAHNIELAPKVENLQTGKDIAFSGEFEWNNKGGVVHWTHHDPKGLHPGGWLVYDNHKYE